MEAYDDLRDITVFMHAHRNGKVAWHNDAPGHDSVVTLKSLKLDYVLEKGYANLRCAPIPGCPAAIQPMRDRPTSTETEQNMADAWEHIFPDVEVPEKIGVACCAQFAVTKQQIRSRPKEDYERIFQWLMETPLDDAISGRIMEYLWHVIFGREPQQLVQFVGQSLRLTRSSCPDDLKCYCDTYGMCSTDGKPPFENKDDED